MSNITLSPYIFFQGNCREAMEFYKSVFGGDLFTQSYDETPGDTPPGFAGKLMHASLQSEAITIMGSDTEQASAKAAKISLSINGTDEEKLSAIFNTLGEGGNIEYPLKKEFWGDIFGSLTDKFGVEWMVSISTEEPKS